MGMIFLLRDQVEMQLAWYLPGGTGYIQHTDAKPDDGSFEGQRRITVIVYCNSNWEAEHGGQLRLWPPCSGGDLIDVEPIAGRLLIFLSGCIPHAVLPMSRDRA